ncbi:MAG: DUF2752 domain-containing protein [Burkholderiales bacterium]
MANWLSTSKAALSGADRKWRLAVGSVLPLGVVIAPAFLALGDVSLCAFKHLTGVPCPLCGGIRVCAALAQGDFSSAWHLNAGLLVLLCVAAMHSVLLMVEAVQGQRTRIAAPRALLLAWQLVGAGLLASWGWHLCTGA